MNAKSSSICYSDGKLPPAQDGIEPLHVLHSLPLLKLQHQRLETHSKVIRRLINQRRTILPFRKRNLELIDDLGCDGSNLHICEVPPNTTEGTC